MSKQITLEELIDYKDRILDDFHPYRSELIPTVGDTRIIHIDFNVLGFFRVYIIDHTSKKFESLYEGMDVKEAVKIYNETFTN